MARIDTLEKFLEVYGDKPALQTLVDEFEIPTAENFPYWREACRDFFDERDKPSIPHISETLDKVHNVHVNDKDKSLISYFPDEEKLKRDTPTSIKLGKYLTKFYDTLDNDDIKHIVSEHKYRFSPPELFIITDGDSDKAEWVYENGPRSCMKREAGYIKTDQRHPCRIYNGTGDLALAYIMKGDRVTTRTVLNTRTKQYVKIHGEAPLIAPMLKDLGYVHASDLGEALIPRIPAQGPAKFLMPYIDGEAILYEKDEDFFLLNPHSRSEGSRIGTAHETTGYVEGKMYDQTWCEYCETYHPDENITRIDDKDYCNGCIEDHFIPAMARNGSTPLTNPRTTFTMPFNGLVFRSERDALALGWVKLILPGNVITYRYISPDGDPNAPDLNPSCVVINGMPWQLNDINHERLRIIPTQPPAERYTLPDVLDNPSPSQAAYDLAINLVQEHNLTPNLTHAQVADFLSQTYNTPYSAFADPLVNLVIAALLATPTHQAPTQLTEVA